MTVPLSVWALTATLGAGGVAGAVTLAPGDAIGPWWLVAPLTLALTIAGTLQVEYRYRKEVEALDLFDAVLAPVVLLFAGPVAIAIAAVAKLVSQLRLGVAPTKIAFNVAMWSATAAAASATYLAMAGAAPSPTRSLVALVVAMLVAAVVNEVALDLVLWFAQQLPLREVLADLAPGFVPGWIAWGVSQAFGLLFAMAVASVHWLALAVILPLTFMHWAHRAHLAAQADKARLEGLHRATAVLADPVDPADAITAFVAEVRASFAAEAAELVLFDPPVVHRDGRPVNDAAAIVLAEALVADEREVVQVLASTAPDALAAQILAAGRHDAMAAAVRSDGEVVGALCVYDRSGFSGFEDGEASVLRLLAADASRALEKHQLLTAVVEERRKLSEIVQRSSDGIFTVDAEGRVGSWNPAMEAMTGFRSAEMEGRSRLAALRARDDSGTDVDLESWRRATHLPGDLRILTHEGVERILACSYATSPDGETLVVVARDVTAARELERLREDFVSTVSHELRTPLTSIVGFTNLLLDPEATLPEPAQRESLVRIRTGARRLERLVANLLELSRIEAVPTTVPAEDLDLREVLDGVVTEIREAAPDRQLVVDVPDGPLPVRGVSLSIERILVNLLTNAARYAHEGPIELSVRLALDSVSVTVTDHGPGIPVEARAAVFERFSRLDTANQQAGTGLGLYIARQLAHHMGATLTVGDRPGGRGAAFTLRLQAATSTDSPALLDLRR